jgi:hypothetical protein
LWDTLHLRKGGELRLLLLTETSRGSLNPALWHAETAAENLLRNTRTFSNRLLLKVLIPNLTPHFVTGREGVRELHNQGG